MNESNKSAQEAKPPNLYAPPKSALHGHKEHGGCPVCNAPIHWWTLAKPSLIANRFKCHTCHTILKFDTGLLYYVVIKVIGIGTGMLSLLASVTLTALFLPEANLAIFVTCAAVIFIALVFGATVFVGYFDALHSLENFQILVVKKSKAYKQQG